MDEKSLKYLKALKERGYSQEDAFAALNRQLSKDVTAPVEAKAAPSSFSERALEKSKEGYARTANLYKEGKIGAAGAAAGVLGSAASGILGQVAEEGAKGTSELLPYATTESNVLGIPAKLEVKPEDSMLSTVGKTLYNVPGGVYNLAAGLGNIAATGGEEIVGTKPRGATGGAIIGGLAGLGKSAIEKVGEVAGTTAEKGAVAGASKAFELGTKTLAENPAEVLAGLKPEAAGELGKVGFKAAKKVAESVPTAAKFMGRAAGKATEGVLGKVTGADIRDLKNIASKADTAEAMKAAGGSTAEYTNILEEFKKGAEADLSEKGQLGQLYAPIKEVPVNVPQSVVEGSIQSALKRHGIEIQPEAISSVGKIDTVASDIGKQGDKVIESALNEVRNKLFKDGELRQDLTGMDFHNVRKVLDRDYLDWNATTPAGSAENAIKSIRGAIDTIAKDYVPGLKELDAKFSEVSGKIDQVAKEFFTKSKGGGYELKADIISRIKNADSPLRLSDRMDILEKYVPGIKDRLSVANSLRQIEMAEAKFGSAHRSVPVVLGAGLGSSIAGPVGGFIGGAIGTLATPSAFADLFIKAGKAARKLGIKLSSGEDAIAASETISRKLAKAQKLTEQEAADAAQLIRAQSKVQVREKMAEQAKQENLYRTHPAYKESPLNPDFIKAQRMKAEKLKADAEAYKAKYPVDEAKVAKEVETPILAQANSVSELPASAERIAKSIDGLSGDSKLSAAHDLYSEAISEFNFPIGDDAAVYNAIENRIGISKAEADAWFNKAQANGQETMTTVKSTFTPKEGGKKIWEMDPEEYAHNSGIPKPTMDALLESSAHQRSSMSQSAINSILKEKSAARKIEMAKYEAATKEYVEKLVDSVANNEVRLADIFDSPASDEIVSMANKSGILETSNFQLSKMGVQERSAILDDLQSKIQEDKKSIFGGDKVNQFVDANKKAGAVATNPSSFKYKESEMAKIPENLYGYPQSIRIRPSNFKTDLEILRKFGIDKSDFTTDWSDYYMLNEKGVEKYMNSDLEKFANKHELRGSASKRKERLEVIAKK